MCRSFWRSGSSAAGLNFHRILHLCEVPVRRHAPAMPTHEEQSLWKGTPSQWLNLWPFVWSLLGAAVIIVASILLMMPLLLVALIFPIVYSLWKVLVVRNRIYELTTERLRVQTGVFNHELDEIELYRVKDTLILRAWWERMANLGSIRLETSDRTQPVLMMPGIPKGQEVREMLRTQVEIQRDRKRVRELDVDDAGDGMLI